MLLDLPRRGAARPGRLHGSLVNLILQRAEDVDSALAIVEGIPRSGAWSLVISDHRADRLCYVEYDGAAIKSEPHAPRVTAANHALLHASAAAAPDHSRRRLARLSELLDAASDGLSLDDAQRGAPRSLRRATASPSGSSDDEHHPPG